MTFRTNGFRTARSLNRTDIDIGLVWFVSTYVCFMDPDLEDEENRLPADAVTAGLHKWIAQFEGMKARR